MNDGKITEGQILTGVMFNEPMRVVITRQGGCRECDRRTGGPELRAIQGGNPHL